MLNFQDFSKFSKILKSTVQYLSRDISNVKIGQLLRQSRKKHWKTLFCPTAFKIKKIKKFDIPSHKFFEYLSSKKNWKSDHHRYVIGLLCPYLYLYVCKGYKKMSRFVFFIFLIHNICEPFSFMSYVLIYSKLLVMLNLVKNDIRGVVATFLNLNGSNFASPPKYGQLYLKT